jgi:hypothetical protein
MQSPDCDSQVFGTIRNNSGTRLFMRKLWLGKMEGLTEQKLNYLVEANNLEMMRVEIFHF